MDDIITIEREVMNYEEEMEVNDDITENELEELAIEFFWENFHGGYGYEIIDE